MLGSSRTDSNNQPPGLQPFFTANDHMAAVPPEKVPMVTPGLEQAVAVAVAQPVPVQPVAVAVAQPVPVPVQPVAVAVAQPVPVPVQPVAAQQVQVQVSIEDGRMVKYHGCLSHCICICGFWCILCCPVDEHPAHLEP
eukprot:SAG31_NODE_3597_length_4085_cov_5.800301_5_plen_138_part_00